MQQLTQDQQNGLNALFRLLADKRENFLVISGPAGVGKTTLLAEFLKKYKARKDALNRLIGGYELLPVITATTNKAVDALKESLREQSDGSQYVNLVIDEACTTASYLGLKLIQDGYNKKMVDMGKSIPPSFIIVDEASFVDEFLYNAIMRKAKASGSKVAFIGDACQLPPIDFSEPIVFKEKLNTIEMTEIKRQASGPLQELCKDLRKFVQGADMPIVKPNGVDIVYLDDEQEFQDMIVDAFRNKENVKFISYLNDRVNEANEYIKEQLHSTAYFESGDYGVCNSYLKHYVKSIKTDQVVYISKQESKAHTVNMQHGPVVVKGQLLELDNSIEVFVPFDKTIFAKIKEERAFIDNKQLSVILHTWADIRPQYACTVHKAQGSTYDTVFFNLDDFQNVYNLDKLSRLLYVAISRARHKVVLIGEF